MIDQNLDHATIEYINQASSLQVELESIVLKITHFEKTTQRLKPSIVDQLMEESYHSVSLLFFLSITRVCKLSSHRQLHR